MNEWIMVAIAIVGTLVLAGGGNWVVKALSHNKKADPKA